MVPLLSNNVVSKAEMLNSRVKPRRGLHVASQGSSFQDLCAKGGVQIGKHKVFFRQVRVRFVTVSFATVGFLCPVLKSFTLLPFLFRSAQVFFFFFFSVHGEISLRSELVEHFRIQSIAKNCFFS